MARLEFATAVYDDFDRFLEHFADHGVQDLPERIAAIVEALRVLTHSPLIGRLVRDGKRELVIGQDARGYVALYRYAPRTNSVSVLAIRSQREADYKHRH